MCIDTLYDIHLKQILIIKNEVYLTCTICNHVSFVTSAC